MPTANKPTRVEINCETGEVSVIELTPEEIAQNEKDAIAHEAQKKALEAETQAKAEIKASALAKLAALGLTEEEANAIAGA
jgi:hypothetical protein